MVFKTADVVKAEGGVGFGQKSLMMELQSLQEALKLEIQIHQKLVAQMKQDPQNAELKLQLRDLQAKITALSERQKKVVEQLRRDLLVKQESAEIRLQTQTQLPLQADGKTTTLVSSQSQSSLPPTHLSNPQNSMSVTPVIATKTLPLMLRAATPTTPIAMMPTPTIAMVTTLTNTPLPSLPNSDSQNLPVSLQTSCKPSNQGVEPVRIVPKNTIVVMPKPPSAPVTPAVLQPALTSTQVLQQPVYLTAKLSSTLLPSSGPVHQLHIFNPPPPSPAPTQPCPPNTQTCPPNTQPSPPNTQPCHSIQPGAAIIQPSASITQSSSTVAMTLSTSISMCSSGTMQHNLSGVHILAQPCKPQTALSEQPGVASANTETPPSVQSSERCPDTLTPSAVGRVESNTAPSSPAGPQPPASTPTTTATPTQENTQGPTLLQSPVPKRQDNPLKLAFMVSLGLVTHDYLEEIQSKRQERKRRTTANPVYSGAVFEPERKKSTVSYLNSANQGCRKRGRPPKHSRAVEWAVSPLSSTPTPALPLTPSSHPPPFSPGVSPRSVGDGDTHDDFCVVCRRSGQLLMCDTCSRVYHLDCLAPALRTVPRGMWICPSCQNQISKKEEAIDWPGPLAIVHSYISYKAEREQEKQKLEKWSSELRQEREELQLRVKQLSDSITICRESRNRVLARQKEMETSIDKVKGLVRLIRGIQLPSLPLAELPPTDMANGDMDCAAAQQPRVECSLTGRTSTSRLVISATSGELGDTAKPSACPKDAGDTAHTLSTASSPELEVDATGGKKALLRHHSSATKNCPTLSNSLGKSAAAASLNGALEPEEGHEESVNRNNASDVNKNNNTDINRNSIRDPRGIPEPPLPAVLPLAEVIQGIE
ncbi:PHD finger protein 21Aa isoform X2 [Brachyhypopomus gauderio]|uniref:PHD finger protein 21Aa isoform X2 n=1 Tax=Brachyhypopomus gauderio TaxID=698409 RepID=UPI004041A971